MSNVQRYFGRIIFPDEDHTLNDVWLTINGNKIFVELADPNLGKEDWGVIWGEFNKLGTVSLLECGLGSQLSGFGGTERKLIAYKLVQGHKLESLCDRFITNCTLLCPTLENWITVNSGIKKDNNTYTIPEPLKVLDLKTSDFSLELKLIHAGTYSFNELTCKRGVNINVKFNTALDISQFYVWKKNLERLIVFLTNDDPQLEITNINNTQHRIFGIDSIWQSNRFAHGVNFKYNELEEVLPLIFENWFDTVKLMPIVELISEKKANPDLSIPRYFLNMCVALESLHDNFINRKLKDEVSIENVRIVKELIIDNNDMLQWFEEVTKYSSNPDFINKLNSQDLKTDFNQIISTVFKIPTEDLLVMIKQTRNKLAHDGRYNTAFKDEFSLFIVAYSLEMLLQIRITKILINNNEPILQKLSKNAEKNVRLFAEWNNYRGITS